MEEYYVYVYLDPRKEQFITSTGVIFEHEPFYVGKGKGRRAWCHMNINDHSNNSLKKGKLKRILDSGYAPKIIFYKEQISEDLAMITEQNLIADIGTKWCITGLKRGPLTNMTSGGDGYAIADEFKMRSSRPGASNWMFGKTHTPEAKAKIREQSIKLHHSDETKKQMSKLRSFGGSDFRGKTWIVIYPDGTKIKTNDLKDFCKKEKLPYGSLYGSFLRNKPIVKRQFKGYQLVLSN